jgi:hypothetical protein
LDFLLLEDASRAAPFHKEGPEWIAPLGVILIYVIILALLTWRGYAIVFERRAARAFVDREFKTDKRGFHRRNERIDLIKAGLSLNDARERLADISGFDISEIASIYSPIKIAIWILPVIGFVGTALGMSVAIGGFSEALGGDTAAMTGTLGHKVIPGLAGAFYTTITALLAAVVCHYCATLLQGYEEDLVDQLDKGCLKKLGLNVSGTIATDEDLKKLKHNVDNVQTQVDDVQVTLATISRDVEALKAKAPKSK